MEDYGIPEVTWCRHIVEALELRPEAALSKGAIMEREKVRGRSRKRKKFRFIWAHKLMCKSPTKNMVIFVFVVDTSASMNQRTSIGTTLLDVAKNAVETFTKVMSLPSVQSEGLEWKLFYLSDRQNLSGLASSTGSSE